MKKIIFTIALASILAGCGGSIFPIHYQKAEQICETRDGIFKLYVDADIREVVCNSNLKEYIRIN